MERVSIADFIDWEKLRGKTVLITGATGLIGFNLTHALHYTSKKFGLGLKILAVVRNIDKARKILPEVELIVSDVESLKQIDGPIDYVIHGASPTASRYFIEHPAGMIATALNGTANVLRIAKEKAVSGLVYLSSMEAYGHVGTEYLLSEPDLGYIDPLKPRSSYPESKRMCEGMCAAYAHEYGLPAKIIRLALTFGPGTSYDDKRITAEAMRCVIDGRDILLKTAGTRKLSYLYTADAVSAILAVLLNGEAGRAYNAANPDTYCSVREMADIVAREVAGGRIGVKIDLSLDSSMYPAPGFLKLDVSALKSLGWRPLINLKNMYLRTIDYMLQLRTS